MSESSHLISKFEQDNGSMHRNGGRQCSRTQSKEFQAGERVEDRGESGSIEEESRKKKRRTEETKTKQRAKKARNFISDKSSCGNGEKSEEQRFHC